MWNLRARFPVVEHVDRVEGHVRIEEQRPHCAVVANSRVEIAGGVGCAVEEQRRLDRVRVGLERLQMVGLAVRLLVADLRTGAEREELPVLDVCERRLRLRERARVVQDLVLARRCNRVPRGHVAPAARLRLARRRVHRRGGEQLLQRRGDARIVLRRPAQGERVRERVDAPVDVRTAADRVVA